MKFKLAYGDNILARRKIPKHIFSKTELDRALIALWTQDDTMFIPERHRVQATLIFHIFCFTGARIGAFFPDRHGKSGLLWRVCLSSFQTEY